jgi:hypothetical protein
VIASGQAPDAAWCSRIRTAIAPASALASAKLLCASLTNAMAVAITMPIAITGAATRRNRRMCATIQPPRSAEIGTEINVALG